MVTVPRLTGPGVAPRPLDIPEFGLSRGDSHALNQSLGGDARQLQALSGAFTRTGNQLFEHGLQQIYRENERKIMELDRALGKRVRDAFYDPEKGILNRRGANAKGATKEATELIGQWGAETEKGLVSEHQRQLWARRFGPRREALLNSTARHEAGQLHVARVGEMRATIEDATEEAYANAGRPEIVAAAKERALAAIRSNPQGLGEKALKETTENYLTKFHVGVVSRLAEGSLGAAQRYLNANKSEIEEKERRRAQKVITARVARAAAKARAEAIYKKASAVYEESGRSFTVAMEEAKKIKDPATRALVERRIRAHHRVAQRDRKIVAGEAFREVVAAVRRGESVDDVGDHLLRRMTPKQEAAARRLEKSRAEGRPIKTNYAKFTRIVSLPRDQFLKATENPEEFVGEFEDRHVAEIVRMRRAYRKKGNTAVTKTMSDAARVKIVADRVGMNDDDRGRLMEEYERRVIMFEKETGKQPNGIERQQILGNITRELRIRSTRDDVGFFGGDRKKRAISLSNSEKGRAYVEYDKIPGPARSKIEGYLRRFVGRAPTKRQVEDIYGRMAQLPLWKQQQFLRQLER